MNLSKSFLILALFFSLFSLSFLSLTVQSVSAQEVKVAVLRGYRAGYSDGYMSGYRDSLENATKSYEKHDEYSRADRAFNKDYGTIEEYRDGYQQGFESGYNTGYEKRSFDATVPANLNRRGTIASKAPVETTPVSAPIEEKTVAQAPVETPIVAKPIETTVAAAPVEAPVTPQIEQKVSENTTSAQITAEPETTLPVVSAKPEYVNSSLNRGDSTTIPVETELIIELLDDVNTERNREGDKFQARIVSPNEIGGAIIEGRVGKIQKPGRIKRRAEITLSFDRIVLPGNRWGNFNAILTEVLPVKGDNVKRIDAEGTIEGRSSVKSDTVKVGAATGTGLVVGAVAGGPVGAAVGASVGAAFGVGGVVIERGKHIRLGKNQQLRIKTAYETQIR